MIEAATDFVKDYTKRTGLLNSQLRALSSCDDEFQRKLLERWIVNNRKWLADNETKHTICLGIIDALKD